MNVSGCFRMKNILMNYILNCNYQFYYMTLLTILRLYSLAFR